MSNEFRYFKTGVKSTKVTENTNYEDLTEKVVVKEGESFLLLPGQLCLGITEEKVTLSSRVCGLLGKYYIISWKKKL